MNKEKIVEVIIERAILVTATADYLNHNGAEDNITHINERTVNELRKIRKELLLSGLNMEGVELLHYYLTNNNKTAWLTSNIKKNYIKLTDKLISDLIDNIDTGE